MSDPTHTAIAAVLDFAVKKARRNTEGQAANYIPELASVPLERTSAAVTRVIM